MSWRCSWFGHKLVEPDGYKFMFYGTLGGPSERSNNSDWAQYADGWVSCSRCGRGKFYVKSLASVPDRPEIKEPRR